MLSERSAPDAFSMNESSHSLAVSSTPRVSLFALFFTVPVDPVIVSAEYVPGPPYLGFVSVV